MSVFPNKNGVYQIEFQIRGNRIQHNAQTRIRKEAEALERELRKEVVAIISSQEAAGRGPLTLDIAAGRYWQEVGQHHVNCRDTERDLIRIVDYFGKDTLLRQISGSKCAEFVAWRRSHTKGGKKKRVNGSSMQKISPATVNRSGILVLKSIFGRAKRVWGHTFPDEPTWRDHLLKEAEERTRELYEGEDEALTAAVRQDYAPWLEFACLTGFRRAETLLKWSNVNWGGEEISIVGKGGLTVRTPITKQVRELLEPLKCHNSEWVFTYIAQKTTKSRIKGKRYPITIQGAKSEWRRTRERSGISDFRFHDIRHDVATKLMRATGNLKLVQRVLNHADVESTMRYAHITGPDVANGLELIASRRQKYLKKSPLPR
jgi:integrase